MSSLQEVNLEYIYVTIPADYVCVYHDIMQLLADYGIEMLKDCKASCTKRNSNVIECFNMFNAAVAARKLGQTKLAETLIKYIKAKINQIRNGSESDTEFTLNIDGKGDIQVYVQCSDEDCKILADAETIEQIINYYSGNDPNTWVCYFGAGEQYNDILSQTYAIYYKELNGNHQVEVVVDGDYIILNMPAVAEYNRITMNGFELPMEINEQFTFNGKDYVSYRSSNAYVKGKYTLTIE